MISSEKNPTFSIMDLLSFEKNHFVKELNCNEHAETSLDAINE